MIGIIETIEGGGAAGLTERQLQCFEEIKGFIRRHGRPPTLAEIGRLLNLKAKSGVQRLLVGLRERGVIDWDRGHANSIRITRPGTYALPSELERRLSAYCRRHGEAAQAIVTDAVLLHLDEMEAD